MLSDIYNERILSLAANLPRIGRLASPDGSATAHSRLCGSTITVDVTLDAEGRVADFAHDVKACALGQASSSIMASHVIGMGAAELRGLRDAMRAMLKTGGDAPDGRWADCVVFEKVRDYKPRHASTLLTFDATLTAVEAAERARGGAERGRVGEPTEPRSTPRGSEAGSHGAEPTAAAG